MIPSEWTSETGIFMEFSITPTEIGLAAKERKEHKEKRRCGRVTIEKVLSVRFRVIRGKKIQKFFNHGLHGNSRMKSR